MNWSINNPPETAEQILSKLKGRMIYHCLYQTKSGSIIHHRFTDKSLQMLEYNTYMANISIATSDVLIWDEQL